MEHEKLSAHSFSSTIAAKPNSLIVDVRTPGEFATSHVPGAVNLPLNSKELGELCSNTSCKDIFIMCQGGKRSESAVAQLRSSNHKIIELQGGLNSWIEAGLPLIKGDGVISIERQVRIGAGALVLLGIILSLFGLGSFIFLSAFVGAGLVFAGITDTCAMGMFLAKMPWNNPKNNSSSDSSETKNHSDTGSCCS